MVLGGPYRTNWFDSYIHGGKVAIEKGRIGSIILLQLVHVLGKELKPGWGSDIDRIFASEVHELVVEGGHHLHGEASHDVLDQVQSDGDVVEVFHILELLDDPKLAGRVLILGARFSATSWTDS